MQAGASDAAQSCSIDLDYLTTCLENISADRQALPWPSFLALTISMNEEKIYRLDLVKETKCYNTLINEGSWPSHSVSLGCDIFENSEEYCEILLYWQHEVHDGWKVFETQMRNWWHFCRWQQKNREKGHFHKYAEGVKQGLTEHEFTQSFQLNEDPKQQDKLIT